MIKFAPSAKNSLFSKNIYLNRKKLITTPEDSIADWLCSNSFKESDKYNELIVKNFYFMHFKFCV